MLEVIEDVILVEVCYQVFSDDMFQDFAADTCERDRPVICWIVALSFLEYRAHVGFFPISRDLACVHGLLENKLQDRSYQVLISPLSK